MKTKWRHDKSFFHRLILNASVLGIAFASPSVLADSFWQSHAQGWHWYESKPVPQDNLPPQPSQTPSSAAQTLAQIQVALKESRAQALLDPTPEHVANYIALQNLIVGQATAFGNVWQQVIWQTPSLNYSLAHPTNQLAQQVQTDQIRANNQQTLKQLAKHYGLFFFFSSTCPYCHKFAPTIKDVEETYGFSVIPVSLDGGSLPEYPNPERDSGQANMFHVTQWPAVFLVDPKAKKIIPVTFGLISEDELTQRIVELAGIMSHASSTQEATS